MRMTFRRLRQLSLLLLLAVVAWWGALQWRADHHVFAWERPIDVLVVCVAAPNADPTDDLLRGFLARFLMTSPALESNLGGVARWCEREFARHSGRSLAPVRVTARGPLKALEPPPQPPDGADGFLERWRGTTAFLGYFEELGKRENLALEGYDARVFVYFYGEDDVKRYAHQHSIASRRDRLGVVFSAVGPTHFARAAAVVAHELCHTLGATDKYEGERCLYPEGYAEPDKVPRFPQTKAEIMALGIPVSENVERRVDSLTDCVVGTRTAREIGWAPAQ